MENIWTKVTIEISKDEGKTWDRDTRFYCGDLTNDNQFSKIENKRKVVLESLVYTDKSTSEFKPDTDIIKEVKL